MRRITINPCIRTAHKRVKLRAESRNDLEHLRHYTVSWLLVESVPVKFSGNSVSGCGPSYWIANSSPSRNKNHSQCSSCIGTRSWMSIWCPLSVVETGSPEDCVAFESCCFATAGLDEPKSRSPLCWSLAFLLKYLRLRMKQRQKLLQRSQNTRC